MNNEEEKTTVDPAQERLQDLSRRGLNAATGGAWNKVRNAPIIGNAAKKAENKLADKLGQNRLANKLANRKNHQKPNVGAPTKDEENNPSNPKSGDVGTRNLRNSLANKAKNLWNQRKNKKKKKEDDSNNSENKEDNTNEEKKEDDNNSNAITDDVIEKRIRRIKIKIIIWASIIGLGLLLVFAIFIAIFGIDIGQIIPSAGPGSYKTENFQSTYEEGTEEYKKEISYYEKLQSVGEDYSNENTDELKTSYIHAILLYAYFSGDNIDYDDSNQQIAIDYKKMEDKVDTFANILKSSTDENGIDYKKNGLFYNALKENDDFKNYYKKTLEKKNIDDLLDEIFDLAEGIDETTYVEETVVTTETTVTVTEAQETTTTTSEVKPKTMSINEYISNSTYANVDSLNNSEMIKAYTIASSTNIVAENKKLTINSNNASITGKTCSVKEGCSYNESGILVDGPGERNNKNTIYRNGGYYYKTPLSSDEISSLNKSVNSVFGNVLVKSDGTYPNLDLAKIVGMGDSDYKTILKSAYGSYDIKNIGEGSYVLDASYGDGKVLTDVIFYDQTDYTGKFCGLKGSTIKGSGCGVTAMAMIVSTYENDKQYDPTWANEIARKNGQCSKDGTYYSHFTNVSKQMGYKTKIYSKNKANGWKISKTAYNNILKNLAKGNLVIANVVKGHFTGGGHYIVLGGIDPETKKVYVYDPNNKNNSKYRKTGNGWYSFNDIIAPETKAYIIVEKKG